MWITLCWLATASLMTATSSLPALPAANATRDEKSWNPENVDDAWADKVLADPEYDRGWMQRCNDDWNGRGESTCEVRELAYHPGKNPIAIDGGDNGGMTVLGSDRSEPRVIYRVKARARTLQEAQELVKQVSLEVTRGRIQPRGPEQKEGRSWSVEVKAWVPRSSDLSLEVLNGPVGVKQVTGTMDIHAVNGPVALIELAGAVSARVQNGPLHVELTGAKWSGAGLDAEAENGPVDLVLPRRYSARLQSGTVNGPSNFDYPLGLEGRLRGHFTTTLGSGGPPVRVWTENGPIHIGER